MILKEYSKKKLGSFLRVAAILFLFAIFMFPIYSMVMTSFQPVGGYAEDRTPPLIPKILTLESYDFILSRPRFVTWLYNSLVVSLITTIFSTIFASLAGYGLSRLNFRGKKLLRTNLLIFQMIPGVVLIVPYFLMMRKLGLISTHTSLILAYTSFTQPFCIWMLIGFFDAIPRDLDECAMIDGATRFGAFLHIILPLATPGISATAIFAFILAWQEYLFSLVLALHSESVLLPQGLASMAQEFDVFIEPMMAGALLVTIPVVIVYVALEKYFVAGLTAGAVKG